MTETAPRVLRLGKVGDLVPRADAPPKVKGEFAYASDLIVPGMLWGHTLRSPHAHARIASVDITEALTMPGVHAVLTHADVPGQKTYGLEFQDQPVLAIDRVLYFGEAVALVAAEHPEQARRAAERIVVAYELLEPVADMERATESAPLHAESPTRGHGYFDDPRPNVVRHMVIRHGDPETSGDVSVSGVYDIGIQDQAFLGPGVRARRSGWRGRGRHLRRDAVAARRPRAGRAVPRSATRPGADPPRRCRRGVRRA